MRARRRAAPGILLTALALLATGCAENAPQDWWEPEGPVARTIKQLSDPVFWIAIVIFFLVEGLIVFALIRFRERPGRGIPRQTHGNQRLEIAWTILPALLLAGVAIPTVGTILALSERPAGNALEIKVTAAQWWWNVQYPDLGVTTANEIHIPTERPVYLTLESIDVIHSFWVPKLAGKQDMVPGRQHNITLQADRPGTYLGQCAEFCWLAHALMRLRVIAQTPEDFDAWVQGQRQEAVQPDAGLAAEGQEIFANGACVGCHVVRGLEGATGTTGPELTHFATRTTFAGASFRNTPENLAAWLDDPPEMKPGAKMPDYGLSRDEIEALVAYLETLR